MSLVDQALPSGGPVTPETNHVQTAQQSEQPFYTSHQSPDIQSRLSIDSTVYQEFYAPENTSQEAIDDSKKRPAMQNPPALPQKSSLRASRVLDAEATPITQTTPHDVYLSSEEEPSSSADDFSDYDDEVELYDSSSEESQKSPVGRKSCEDTARVVSVIFSGRPSIIDVSTSRRSVSPSSVEARRSIEPASTERRPRTSITSTPETASSPRPSTSSASAPLPQPRPPRSSSMVLPLVLAKNQPAFLNSDPFPNRGECEHTGTSTAADEVPRPRMPSAVLKSVTRSLSIVKKRSRPLLNTVSAGASTSRATPEKLSSPSTPTLALERPLISQNHELSQSVPSSPPMSSEFVLHSEPVSRQASSAYVQPLPPRTPTGGSVKGKLLAMARRKSIHIRAARA